MRGVIVGLWISAGVGLASQAAAPVAGTWQGVLEVGGVRLRIVVHISEGPDGTLAGTLDSPDQAAVGIPLDAVTFQAGVLRFEQKRLQIVFEGQMSPGGDEITGEFRQSGTSVPLTLRRTDEKPSARRPQEPQRPYPYDEEEVVYENKKAGVRLAGTLTRPRSGGPSPAVLLITGSGPQDRDETVAGHRPFLILADFLTRRGIAVLRVDDRGVGGSTGSLARATTEDLAEDVRAGVAYLKSRPDIDPRRIGLIGHSEGGLIAAIVAAKSRDVAFIVLLATPGLRGEDSLYLQAERIARAAGVDDEAIARNRRLQERLFAILREEKDEAVAGQKLREVLAKALTEPLTEEGKGLPDPQAVIEAQVQSLLSPWFRFFLTYDPGPTLRKVRVPVLALFGEKDLQVPAPENPQAVEKALRTAGHRDFTVRVLPGLNHLFQTCRTGLPAEYAEIEETFAPAALEAIGNWVQAHVRKP